MTDQEYDIAIVGGGMIGASLALALGNSRYQVVLIEAVPVAGSALATAASSAQPSFNERMTATSPSSKAFFSALQCWDKLESAAATIRRIHVSNEGRFGTTRLSADDIDEPALGYNLANQRYGQVLFDRLAELPNVDVLCPARLQDLQFIPDDAGQCDAGRNSAEQVAAAELTISQPSPDDPAKQGTIIVRTKLVVAADGARSTVRDLVGIEADIHDYQQSAIVTAINSKRAHEGTAFERFTNAGPLALLPADEAHRSTVVFTVDRSELDAHLDMTDEAFTALLQERFGWRLGRLSGLGKRLSYPLYRVLAKETVRPRLVVIGNAAHNLHPVAGQGFNLGLRDVAALAEILVEAEEGQADPGCAKLLAAYEAGRTRDQGRFSQLTHGLDKIFANDQPALSALRGLGLATFDILPIAKRRFLKMNLGQEASAPKLSRGQPLLGTKTRPNVVV